MFLMPFAQFLNQILVFASSCTGKMRQNRHVIHCLYSRYIKFIWEARLRCKGCTGFTPSHRGGTAGGKSSFMYPSFLDFWCKNKGQLLYSLRIDKRPRFEYNKARNQRSTAEAQERATPADLKQKGARPMVDMEPAQFGQTVGVR